MLCGALKPMVGGLALLAALPVLAGAADPDGIFEGRVLASHNRERDAMGVPTLRWDMGLARSAQGWADHLAATGAFEHAPQRGAYVQGENLWEGTSGYYPVEAQVDAWVREKRYFRPGVFPNNSATGRVADVGHYTQVIWRRTLKVGCAKATNGENDVLVCRYSEAGNFRGETPL